jgi:hypothetical protein
MLGTLLAVELILVVNRPPVATSLPSRANGWNDCNDSISAKNSKIATTNSP